MWEILTQNLGYLVVAAAMALIVASIVLRLVRTARSGGSGCCGGCSHCANAPYCHPDRTSDGKQ